MEESRSLGKTLLVTIAVTTVLTVLIQVVTRLLTGKANTAIAAGVAVPTAMSFLYATGYLRPGRRK